MINILLSLALAYLAIGISLTPALSLSKDAISFNTGYGKAIDNELQIILVGLYCLITILLWGPIILFSIDKNEYS